MNEQQIMQMVDEIETVDFREFWWESELLERASGVRDVRVVRSLALRHHGLSNKEAFSAHVLRNAIKMIDAPTFPLMWSLIDSETDANQVVRRFEDFTYAPWAVAFILGEIGGHGALRGASMRLRPEHTARHYMIVRLISHLLVRYLQIRDYKPPTMTMIDVKTGEMTRGLPQSDFPGANEREALRRSQADELFSPIDPIVIQDIKRGLASMPDAILNMPRDLIYRGLEQVPKRHA
jgi:hypothetical protein